MSSWMVFLLGLVNDMFFAMIPAVGFALVFNVPPKALKYCAVGGAIGHGMRFVMMQLGWPIDWASFVGALVVGFIGVHWARNLGVPPKVFTVASMIPMVPGVYVFKAMVTMVEINRQGYSEALFSALVDNGLTAIFVVFALAIGLAMPGLLLYRKRAIV
ncbi:uncharacterized membrane protein YjjB (DUF3815 family) [Sinobacterium caligoides]|uniref:Uncharacterized membrane protein YjjB (DUF3815 family) n=1 Tax=Sinobacterium caligoides TaxID=933926 RepID=A0A3N2DYJ1_9GAMM|nr:threonine/serine exporter family protein [Sinobacterium caligoides]ROS04911.1 uncharacterized membrane protein YjjB (DUF3815 family) [Sinobacterium caligoides]